MSQFVVIATPTSVEKSECPNEPELFKQLQTWVDGYVQLVPQAYQEKYRIATNEDGKPKGLPHTMHIMGHELVGTIVFAGISNNTEHCGCVGMPEEEADKLVEDLKSLMH